jgi:hypothetical protein
LDGRESKRNGLDSLKSQNGETIMSDMTETQKMRGRPVTHEEAQNAAHHLIDSFFDNPGKPKARASIPVDPFDDDVLILDYIAEQQARNIVAREAMPHIQPQSLPPVTEGTHNLVQPPICTKHNRAMQLVIYDRPGSAPGNGWSCPGCHADAIALEAIGNLRRNVAESKRTAQSK